MNFNDFKRRVHYLTDQSNECKKMIHYYRDTDENYSELFRQQKIKEMKNTLMIITQDLLDLKRQYDSTH